MAKRKTTKTAKAVKVVNKWNAPLSQRPYVTLALLAALVIVLAMTVEMIH